MERSPKLLAVVLCALAVAGCGRFGFASLPLDKGGPSGPGPGPPFDGGGGTDDAGAAAGDTDASAGGGAFDAGSGDAGLGDASLPPLPSGPLDCATITDAIVCETFEAAPTAGRAYVENSASLTYEQGALVARIENRDAAATLNFDLPAGARTLYLRFLLYLPGHVISKGLNFLSFGAKGLTHANDLDFSLVDDTSFQVWLNQPRLELLQTLDELPRDTWTCFEARLQIGDSDGAVRSMLGGPSYLEAVDTDTLPPDGLNEARMGIDYAGPNQGLGELRFDDLLISTTPYAGCP